MIEELLTEHGPTLGYIAVLIGSFVEGETVVLTAGYLAYKGYLSLPAIIIISFLGSLFADQLLYYIGRYYGPSLIERNPKLKEKSKRIFDLLHRYNVGFILSFRFIYGIRVASPLVIGASGISIKRFTILNFIAAIIWAVLSCCAGYLIGYFFSDYIEAIMAGIIKFQKIAVFSVVGIIALGFIIYKLKSKFTKDKS